MDRCFARCVWIVFPVFKSHADHNNLDGDDISLLCGILWIERSAGQSYTGLACHCHLACLWTR